LDHYKEGKSMKNYILRFLACTIVFAFILQPIPTFANTSKIAISDSAPMVFTQTITPLGPDHEIEDRQFELELEAERQPIGEEHVREEGFPDELFNHKHGYNPQEKREYFLSKPYNLEKVAQQVQEFDCSLVTDVSQSECEALLVIYEQTIAGGDGSHTWLSTYTIGDWIGVTVTGGHVVGLDLAIDGKIWPHGMLTPEIADLSFLVSLDICGGYWDRIVMSGGIPPEMGNLSNLEHLHLCYISLSGFIPAELGNLSSLKSLYLIYLDDLEGNIPSELGNLNNLETLMLDFDYGLEGNLPASFGNLVNLKRLSLNNLNLTGCIPAELGKLKNLLYLNLILNDFSCEIPPEFGGMSNLKDLDLRKNYNLSGDLPPELGNLINLTSINISFTKLSGSIPLSFVNLTKLENMIFDGTELCEPGTPEFLAWKATVNNWEGTGIVCETNDVSWLLMYYMAGDNDLYNFLRNEIGEIYSKRNSNMDIAIFFDSKEFNTSYRFYSSNGTVDYVPKGNLNSGNGQTLTDFMLWARSKTTAQNQALIISDHGHGLSGVAQDLRAGGFFHLYDEIDGNELRQALTTIGPIDIIYFMTCLTGNIEFMWELRGLSDYYIAHESTAWGDAKHNYLLQIDQFTTPEALSNYMALDYYNERSKNSTPSTISVINMVLLQDVFSKVNDLAKAIQNGGQDIKAKVWNILTESNLQRFDERFPNGTSTSDRLADLFHFASLVNFIPELSPAASALLDLEDDFVLYNYAWSGTTWDENIYYDHSNAHGVAISLPTNPISFYIGEWFDFAAGADWSYANHSINNTTNTEGYNWGPMISDLIFLYNPNGADDPIPPDLVAPGIKIDLFLPMITH